jgi:hypothetical protein
MARPHTTYSTKLTAPSPPSIMNCIERKARPFIRTLTLVAWARALAHGLMSDIRYLQR